MYIAPMRLNPLTHRDADACYDVFYRAVHGGTQAFYATEQQEAWAPKRAKAPDDWADKLTQGIAISARRWGKIVGFMTMGHDGHIDFAYVLPNEMGKGTALKLYTHCETEARKLGLEVIDTQASHLAKRFFEKHGWHVTARQMVIRNGVGIENFRMEKSL
ncbi:Acetyltransferase, GNAT family [Pacificibacter marinus]|uniref:Putative acyltransferase n=2 Tax=Pacificibacter marinus TaxID=658057 RepID=A0A1Y5SPK8_9RHOB|nr:Acetyltransferase, GNAT family [Pacificibacter marinus]SLN45380.1 putative acyltransferase [Pacificibacter marinus]